MGAMTTILWTTKVGYGDGYGHPMILAALAAQFVIDGNKASFA